MSDKAPTLPMWTPTIRTDGGPWAEHNMPCAVCCLKKATLDLNTGIFQPCSPCQRRGLYVMVRPRLRVRQWRAPRWRRPRLDDLPWHSGSAAPREDDRDE